VWIFCCVATREYESTATRPDRRERRGTFALYVVSHPVKTKCFLNTMS